MQESRSLPGWPRGAGRSEGCVALEPSPSVQLGGCRDQRDRVLQGLARKEGTTGLTKQDPSCTPTCTPTLPGRRGAPWPFDKMLGRGARQPTFSWGGFKVKDPGVRNTWVENSYLSHSAPRWPWARFCSSAPSLPQVILCQGQHLHQAAF